MKTDVANRFIWYKGEVMNVNDAKINILAPTAQFGLNVFEGIPCYWNDEQKQLYAFRLNDHYDRLLRSARLIQINCPYSKAELEDALKAAVKANEYDENLSVRQTLFVDGFGSWGSEEPVDMFVAPIPRGRTSAEYNKKGLHTCVTSWRRISDTTLSPRIKGRWGSPAPGRGRPHPADPQENTGSSRAFQRASNAFLSCCAGRDRRCCTR